MSHANNEAPKQFQATVSVLKRFRFKVGATAVVNQFISSNQLAAFQSIVLSTVSAQPLFTKVRLVSVEIFGPMSATLEPVTVSLEFYDPGTGIFSNNSKIHTDTSMSSVHCAHIYARPDDDSIASKWTNPTISNSNLFLINCPANTIIDIIMEGVYNDGETPLAAITIASTVYPNGSIGVVPPLQALTALGLVSLNR